MAILITGSEGFIGKKLVDRIKRNTPHDVITYDVRVDRNRTKLHHDYDIIYHLGAVSDTRTKDKDLIYENNIETLQTLINIHRTNPNPSFISFASSASVYGCYKDSPYDTSDPVQPENLYAKSKYAGELLLELSGLPHNSLRLFNVYSTDGVSENHKEGHASPFHTFSKQSPIEIFEGSEHILRDFIHVDDVVEAFIMLTCKEGLFNIGTSVPKSFLEVAQTVSKQTGAEIKTIPFPENLTSYQRYTCASKSVYETINQS